jgi:hypothetical protein
MRHIVMFSGGANSWATAKRVAAQYGTDDLTLLFADTMMEDEDLYRFIEEAARDVGAPLVRIADGRTPWEVFFDERYLGNTRADPCSKILKRHLLDKWRDENCDPADTVIHFGIDWSEIHRFETLQERITRWRISAPLCEKPYLVKNDILHMLIAAGIEPPRLYRLGFNHNNCGGFCIKQGQAGFANLLRTFPERYAFHESKEQELRDFLGKDVSILRDRRGGDVRTLTLAELRRRVTSGGQIDLFDWGGCGCAVDIEEVPHD